MFALLNSFSLNMINVQETKIEITEITIDQVKDFMRNNKSVSYIGHKDFAEILTKLTDFNIPMNRSNFCFGEINKALVFHYSGPRLEEGTTVLPENATIKFFHVKVR